MMRPVTPYTWVAATLLNYGKVKKPTFSRIADKVRSEAMTVALVRSSWAVM